MTTAQAHRACWHVRSGGIASDVFRSTSVAIIVTDTRPRIVLANGALLAATGYRLEDLVGQHPRVLGSGRDDRSLYRAISRSIAATDHWSGQIRTRGRNDETSPVWLQIDVIRDAHGRAHHYVAALCDLTPFSHLHNELHRLAYHDGLTGLPNRQLFQDRIERAIVRARRHGTGFSLLFIDLDGFKQANDQLGHCAGDRLLVEVARRLCATTRASDTVARLAGDEFVAILEGTKDERDAASVAMKIIRALSLPMQEHGGGHISASIGIALFPRDGGSAEELIGNADAAMYRAKVSGRARYCLYSPELDQRASAPCQSGHLHRA